MGEEKEASVTSRKNELTINISCFLHFSCTLAWLLIGFIMFTSTGRMNTYAYLLRKHNLYFFRVQYIPEKGLEFNELSL